MSPTKRKIRKNIFYGLYLLIAVILLLEIALRIYNPFHIRIKGNHIILPVSQKQIIRNTINPKLDSVIINSRNSLGFRGAEKPPPFEDFLSIITVGGSTTECHFLSDNKTWPYLLGEKLNSSFKNVWLNNAGLDGHSTFGHQVLLNDYLIKIKPKVILFLVGINDMENDQPTFHDKLNSKGAYADFKHFIFNNSEVLNLSLNMVRGWRAQRMNNTTNAMLDIQKGNHFVMDDEQIAERKRQQEKYLVKYQQRVEQLIDTCLHYTIYPIFITQSTPFGVGIDSATGINMETFELGDKMNGKCLWEVLQLYNNTLKEICVKRNLPVIDLSNLMPRNNIYYYDQVHYTNKGAEKVAEIVDGQLKGILTTKYPAWQK